MPKIKTNKSASKRFHVTGSGKLVRTYGGKSHLRRKKRSSAKRMYAKMVEVSSHAVKRIKRLLPYGV